MKKRNLKKVAFVEDDGIKRIKRAEMPPTRPRFDVSDFEEVAKKARKSAKVISDPTRKKR